ncbi:MAG: N-acetylneuraminate synthase family protein [Dehalococcoidia bacterium]|nr:N-acetylneuraminate synthase family protein [Dehalococcoidia bacterium]
MKTVDIAGRPVGPDRPVLIVAEVSGNHGGSLQAAVDLIGEAKRAGADLLKLQSYQPSSMCLNMDNSSFRLPPGGRWGGQTLWQLYEKAHTPREWTADLIAAGKKEGIPVFTTPFSVTDLTHVGLVTRWALPALKVASFEVGFRRLLEEMKDTAQPVIASTGMATFAEVDRLVQLMKYGEHMREPGLVLMRCLSGYPAEPKEARLWLIPFMSRFWDVTVGWSDHTLGTGTTLEAVKWGASVIERHIALRDASTVDSHFSSDPEEFHVMVEKIRAWEAQRSPDFYPGWWGALPEKMTKTDLMTLLNTYMGPMPCERPSAVFRRGLWFVRDVVAGEVIGEHDVLELRPGDWAGGPTMDPWRIREVWGRRVWRDTSRGEPVIEAALR